MAVLPIIAIWMPTRLLAEGHVGDGRPILVDAGGFEIAHRRTMARNESARVASLARVDQKPSISWHKASRPVEAATPVRHRQRQFGVDQRHVRENSGPAQWPAWTASPDR